MWHNRSKRFGLGFYQTSNASIDRCACKQTPDETGPSSLLAELHIINFYKVLQPFQGKIILLTDPLGIASHPCIYEVHMNPSRHSKLEVIKSSKVDAVCPMLMLTFHLETHFIARVCEGYLTLSLMTTGN